jgi:trehalose-6-phosphatase
MNIRKQMIRESEEDAEIWARWEQEFEEAVRRTNGLMCELKNIEIDEWEYGNIEYDRSTHTLNWRKYSIEVDPTFNVDANLDALMDKIMSTGKYDYE